MRSFDQNSKAEFLQFVTGTSKVPLQGFSQLEGMNGTQKFQIHRDDRSTDRLPCAHTWYDTEYVHVHYVQICDVCTFSTTCTSYRFQNFLMYAMSYASTLY